MDKVPVQIDANKHKVIDKEIAEEAYKQYTYLYGKDQSFKRLHERGGFGVIELVTLLFQRIKRLEKQIK